LLPKIKKLYSRALKEKFALGAFNFSASGIAKAIFLQAQSLKAPFILETSNSEMDFLIPEVAHGIWSGLNKLDNRLCFLHLDHGRSFESAKKAIDIGYPSVHIDGSKLDYRDNLKMTRKVVNYAKKKRVWVSWPMKK